MIYPLCCPRIPLYKKVLKAFSLPIAMVVLCFGQTLSSPADWQQIVNPTEVALRNGEKLDQFTGTFDQYRTDFITPLVKRIIGILFRAGKLKDAPPSLMVQPGDDPKADPELAMPKINIKSRVTLALNEVRNVGVQKTVEMLLPLGEQKPEIMDNFNWDEVARGTARNNGMPEAMLLPIKQMLEVRQQRTKMLMEQRALDQAKTASEAGKNLGKAPQQLQDQVTGQLTGQAA